MFHEFSFPQLTKRLFSNSSKYGVGVVLMKLGALLVIPIYWKKLSPEEFGVIGLAQVLTTVLTPILAMGASETIQRFYFEWDKSERRSYLGAMWTYSVAVSLAICIAIDLVGDYLFGHLIESVTFRPYLRMTLWSLFFSNFSVFSISLFRIREDLKKYNIVTLATFLLQMSMALFFILYLNMGVYGYFLSLLLSASLAAVLHFAYIWHAVDLNFELKNFLGPFRFSRFTLISGLFEGLGFVFDRLFLDKSVSLATIGVYSLAMQLAGGYNSVNAIFKSAWIPFIYRVVSQRTDGPRIVGLFSTYSLAVLAIPALFVSMFASDLVEAMGKTEFTGVAVFVPALVLGYYISSMATTMGRGLDIAKSNRSAPIIPIVGIVTSFVLSWALIPTFGAWGAVVSFVATTSMRAITQIYLAAKVYPRPFFWRRNSALVAISFLTFFASAWVLDLNLVERVLLKLLVLAVASVVLIRIALGDELFRRAGKEALRFVKRLLFRVV